MGGKSSKTESQKKAKSPLQTTNSNASQINLIKIKNNSIFPEEIQEYLLSVMEEFPTKKSFFLKRFDSSTPLMKWILELDYTDPFFFALDNLCQSAGEGIQEFYKYISITLQSEADTFILAFLPSGDIAGFTIIGNDFEKPKTLRRYMTCAGPRGVGIGYALVQEIHAIAKERKKNTVILTSATKTATSYHKRQGYTLTGKRIQREGDEMIYTLPKNNTRRVNRNSV